MRTRILGNTGVAVNEIGYGAMHLSIDREKRPTEADSVAFLQRIVDELGINFIDTADAYCTDSSETGHNERLIAAALTPARRQHVLVATKGGSVRPDGRWERDGRPEHLRAACDASLKALGCERIDLYQLHAPDPMVPVEESVGTLADLQRDGKIRFVGVSNFSLPLLERAMKETTIVSLQNQFSVINQREEDEVLAFCEEKGITYIPWNPIGGRGKAPELAAQSAALEHIAARHSASPHAIALAWLLKRSPAMLPIPGTRHFEHMAQNVQAENIELSDEEMRELGGN
ncbi:MAG TPA: aldo/keto reductase [Candidatus Kapabacteria bacterium]|nr:aldo/keto reductase [Candidatus Kapabacteria bacterium]